MITHVLNTEGLNLTHTHTFVSPHFRCSWIAAAMYSVISKGPFTFAAIIRSEMKSVDGTLSTSLDTAVIGRMRNPQLSSPRMGMPLSTCDVHWLSDHTAAIPLNVFVA